MNEPQAEARLFLYDLANLAKEHWFKPDERWAITLANDAEKTTILKQYYPTLHISGETEVLKEIAAILGNELNLDQIAPEEPADRRVRPVPPTYLIAFNPSRQRK
ncbi:hypothetical protein [Mucilaginibacter gilvus]|uniref:Uncharacterized protein n=1 Tax=Mucilaginibacter gilvus TaxID=2305909 RepID=A0A444MQJ9_9SPHI|nr:hypothetical protein [Mucilaginibacter gilvus]RWY53863.1 hypothetical protein EPL05_07285 [Mucilaginibacter gilvus]